MNKPLITIITVCYNAAGSIRQTMESVLSQTWAGIEYLVIDGKSSDDTVQIVAAMQPLFEARGIRFRCLSERDGGIYDAMNKGIGMACGDWINFMNAGDRFSSADVLERLFRADSETYPDVIYGNTTLLLDFGKVRMRPKPLDCLKKKMVFCHQACFVRTGLMKSSLFDLRYRLAADYAFFYSYYVNRGEFRYFDMDIADFESEEGASSRNRLEVNKEHAMIHGVADKWSWKLWYAQKCCRVKFKEFLYRILPASLVRTIRSRNYKRLQKRRNTYG